MGIGGGGAGTGIGSSASSVSAVRLQNAKLIDGRVVDIDLAEGRIAAIFAAGTAKPDADHIDLDGRTVVPGLWDEHVHIGQWAAHRRRLSVSDARSPQEVAARVGRAAGAHADAQPLVAVGMRDGHWVEPPTRALLDAATGDVPTMVLSSDLHSSWSNAALGRAVGISIDASGVLREAAHFAALAKVEALADPATLDSWVDEALHDAAARGVVGIVDLDFHDAAEAWARRGSPPIRVAAGVYPAYLDNAESRGDRTGRQIVGLAEIGPLKVITDGALGTRTAYCHEPYPGTVSHGDLEVPPEQLRAIMGRAISMGLAPAIHAIGDAANALAIDTFESLGAQGRIEHAQLVTDADVARMARLGIVASIQPEHMLDDRELVARYWPGREHSAYRIRSLLDAGVRVVFGSDAPVAPLDPWLAIAAAVTRTRDGDEPWLPAEGVDIATALACSARSRIRVGEPADIVALGDEPDVSRLRTMPVDATFVAGELRFSQL